MDRPWGFQEFETLRFQDKQHMKVVSFQPYTLATFTPKEIFLTFMSGSIVGIATRYGLEGPEIESQWGGGQILRTRLDRPWD
jgi:hypothetical protein